MRQQIGPPYGFEIRRRLSERRAPVACEKARRQMQRQRQIAEFRGDRIQDRVVRRHVRPVLAQQRQALDACKHAERHLMHAEMQAPGSAAAGDQHPAAARTWSPPREQSLVLAVVEHEEARQRALPLGRDQPDLLFQGQAAEVVAQLHSARPAAGGDLRRDRRGIGETQPEDAAREILSVSMDELAGELTLADAAEPGDRGQLADSRRPAGLERSGERLQIFLAAHEQGVTRKRHVRALRQRRRRRHDIQRHLRQVRLGLRQPLVLDLCWRRVLECGDERCGLRFEQQPDLVFQIVLKPLLERFGAGDFRSEALLLPQLIEERVYLPALVELLFELRVVRVAGVRSKVGTPLEKDHGALRLGRSVQGVLEFPFGSRTKGLPVRSDPLRPVEFRAHPVPEQHDHEVAVGRLGEPAIDGLLRRKVDRHRGRRVAIVPAHGFEPEAVLEQMILVEPCDQIPRALTFVGDVAGRGQEDAQMNRQCLRALVAASQWMPASCSFVAALPRTSLQARSAEGGRRR
jgi:hypothetical protein